MFIYVLACKNKANLKSKGKYSILTDAIKTPKRMWHKRQKTNAHLPNISEVTEQQNPNQLYFDVISHYSASQNEQSNFRKY